MFPKMFRSSLSFSNPKKLSILLSFFLFPPFPILFSRIRWQEIFSNPDESLPGDFQNWKIDVSNRYFAGRKREKKKEKNKLKGKDFTDASRASGLKRVRTIQAGRIGAFIYSSRNSFVTRQTCKNTKIGIAFRNLVRRGY